MMDKKAWKELNEEIANLSGEYARLKNKPKPFETESEKEKREDQLRNDRHEKWQEFDSLGADFEKKERLCSKIEERNRNHESNRKKR